MFDSLKAAIQDLLHGRVAPGDRRAAIVDMKRALVSAQKLGVDDLREGVEVTRRRVTAESEQLATMQRRTTLATGISDTETVALAEQYEAQHSERPLAVLERELEAQEAEATLAERDLAEMMSSLKAAGAGVGSGAIAGAEGPSDEELGLRDDAKLHGELDGLARAKARTDADAAAEEKLAALKKKMGL